jgi:hypothetical protein
MDRTDVENEVVRRRRVFSEKFADRLGAPALYRLPLDTNAEFMEEVDPSNIHLAVMSNMTCAETWELWFYSFVGMNDDSFCFMCRNGDLETVFTLASMVQEKAALAKEIVSSSEKFEVLQKFLTYRDGEDEGYTEDMSDRDIWNFGSVLGLLDPTNTPKGMKTLSLTLRLRLRNYAFPPFVHDNLEDRDGGDLDEVHTDHEDLLQMVAEEMKLDKDDITQDLPRLLWSLRNEMIQMGAQPFPD